MLFSEEKQDFAPPTGPDNASEKPVFGRKQAREGWGIFCGASLAWMRVKRYKGASSTS